MSVLLLRLSGPMQSWGDSSRFVRRATLNEPTKSGVVGLLAAALGRSREDSVEDLASLEFGVRTDQVGRLMSDFQTERPLKGKPMPLSHRYYLADARFLVALGGDKEQLESLDAALRSPKWPLYLGRRSCPPDMPVSLGVRDEYKGVRDALGKEPWAASDWYRRRSKAADLEISCDGKEGEPCTSQCDFPLSFSGEGRRYANRAVYRYRIPCSDVMDATCGNEEDEANSAGVANENVAPSVGDHDPMGFF